MIKPALSHSLNIYQTYTALCWLIWIQTKRRREILKELVWPASNRSSHATMTIQRSKSYSLERTKHLLEQPFSNFFGLMALFTLENYQTHYILYTICNIVYTIYTIINSLHINTENIFLWKITIFIKQRENWVLQHCKSLHAWFSRRQL